MEYSMCKGCSAFPGIGILLGANCGIFYAVTGLFVKLLEGNVSAILLTWTRATSLATFSLFVMVACRQNLNSLTSKQIPILLLVGLFSLVARASLYYSYQTIPLADALTVLGGTPVFALCVRTVTERVMFSVKDVIIVLIILLGETLCVQPTFLFGDMNPTTNIWGYCTAALAAFCSASTAQMMRSLKEVHVSLRCLVAYFVAALLCTIYILGFESFHFPSDEKSIIHILCFVAFVIPANYLGIIALSFDNVVMVTIGKSIDIVASLFIDVIYFHRTPNVLSVCGASLVFAAIVVPPVIEYSRSSLKHSEPLLSPDDDTEE